MGCEKMVNGELIVDNFAGGGGASTGIEIATGQSVDIAINHDPKAILMHKTNHPSTKHYCESVWDVDPIEATEGKPVALAWFSPDCKHFSKAKGSKPKDKNIRGLAWVTLRWGAKVRPRVIILENVEEFQEWGPLNRKHRPIKSKIGQTFRKFISQLEGLGYSVEYRELSCRLWRADKTKAVFHGSKMRRSKRQIFIISIISAIIIVHILRESNSFYTFFYVQTQKGRMSLNAHSDFYCDSLNI